MGSQNITLQTAQRTWTSPSSGFVIADNSATKPDPTTTEPAVGNNAVLVKNANLAKLMFLGKKSAGGAVTDGGAHRVYVYGWSNLGTIWVPTYIAGFKCTTGTSTGVAATSLDTNIHFCKNVELEDGDNSVRVIGGAGIADADTGVIASATIDVEGATYLSFIYDVDGLTTTADRFGTLVGTI